jgi:membrane protein
MQTRLFPVEDRMNRVLEPVGSGARLHRKPLLKLRGPDIKRVFEEALDGWSKHNAPRLGAALAFYTLLSLMPLLLVVISIAGLVFGPHAAETGVLQQVQLLIGSQRARIVQELLNGAQNRTQGLVATLLGMLTLIFGASGVLTELRAALDTIWEVPPRQLSTFREAANLVKERLWSFAMVIAIGFLLTVSLILSTWISALGALYASVLPAHEVVMQGLTSIFSFLVVTGLFAATYKVVPDVRIEWRDVIPGATVTSLLFTIGNLVLSLYLGKASFSSTYGAAASIVLLTLWVYYSSQIFFLGAEFTKAFCRCYGSRPSQTSLPLIQASGPAPSPGLTLLDR